MSSTRACPSCGGETSGSRFCIHCGFALWGQGGMDSPTPVLVPRPSYDTTAPPAQSGSDQKETRAAGEVAALAEHERHRIALGDQPSTLDVHGSQGPIGSVLAGRFRIDALLGEGGFGAVYRGTHLALGEVVAIKLLHAEWAVQPEFRARFSREARALSRLRHPGIVTVHDFGEDAGRPFLIMELLRGRSLARRIGEGPDSLPPRSIVRIFDQILWVLETTHAAGIVHRDIKPDNVLLLDPSPSSIELLPDTLKVLDFGIALMDDPERSQRLTSTNAVQGTPLYMSPEQCRGRDVGPPTDIYAVGALMFEAMSGVPPFSGDTSTDLMVKHMFMAPPKIAERGWKRAAPPELESLAVWALAKKPEDRPSAGELREALRRAGHGDDGVSRAVKAAEGRVVSELLTREDRALPPAPPSQVETHPRPRDLSAFGGQGPQIAIWQLGRDRADDLRAALAVNGVLGTPWTEEVAPPTELFGQVVKAVVIAGGEQAESRARALRVSAGSAKLPLLVIDVQKPEEIAALIRAGASDVTLGGLGDEAVCKKVWRLIQRGR